MRNSRKLIIVILAIFLVVGGTTIAWAHASGQVHAAASTNSGQTWGIPSPQQISQLPPAKQKLFNAIAQDQIAASKAHHAPKHPENMPASCPSHIITSVTPYQGGLHFTAMGLTVTTLGLFEDAQQRGFNIVAGAYSANLQQGIIMVEPFSTDTCKSMNTGTPKTYLTPWQGGVTTLTAIHGDIVSFKTANGQTGSLNVITGAFQ